MNWSRTGLIVLLICLYSVLLQAYFRGVFK